MKNKKYFILGLIIAVLLLTAITLSSNFGQLYQGALLNTITPTITLDSVNRDLQATKTALQEAKTLLQQHEKKLNSLVAEVCTGEHLAKYSGSGIECQMALFY